MGLTREAYQFANEVAERLMNPEPTRVELFSLQTLRKIYQVESEEALKMCKEMGVKTPKGK